MEGGGATPSEIRVKKHRIRSKVKVSKSYQICIVDIDFFSII